MSPQAMVTAFAQHWRVPAAPAPDENSLIALWRARGEPNIPYLLFRRTREAVRARRKQGIDLAVTRSAIFASAGLASLEI